MKMIVFAHPEFLQLKSMQRYSQMISEGMTRRGHQVEVWSPRPFFYLLPVPAVLKKWLGYIDQYAVFPIQVRMQLLDVDWDTLFVFSDQALGPWVGLVGERPHIVHCHDFLAQRCALGEIPGLQIGITGQIYQRYIRKGYRWASNFISVSEKTRADLLLFLDQEPRLSEVVYNGLSPQFQPFPMAQARAVMGQELQKDLSAGYFLHVGGNYWYKNRSGVLAAYHRWSLLYGNKLPLVLVGEPLSDALSRQLDTSEWKDEVHLISNINDQSLQMLYAGATALLFPSIDEGFGWPIAEAMACGTLVVTTDQAPMTEVAGSAGFMVPAFPAKDGDKIQWADEMAVVMERIFRLSENERDFFMQQGIVNARRFELNATLDEIEKIYTRLI
ncbi:MAG: glycosyltransferase [Bacteroidota bacterium]